MGIKASDGVSSKARPVFEGLVRWRISELLKIFRKSDLAKAVRYALGRLPHLEVYLSNDHLEIDNNAAERGMRGMAVGRKDWLFAGSEGGGNNAAIAYTLIKTAKLNDTNPQAGLTNVLSRIADHPINRVAELAPWIFRKQPLQGRARRMLTPPVTRQLIQVRPMGKQNLDYRYTN